MPRRFATRERRLRGSICSRNCPFLTRSPSLTARFVTRPIVSALMFTVPLRLDLARSRHDRLEVPLLDRLGVDRDAFGSLELEIGEGDGAKHQHDDAVADQDLLVPAQCHPPDPAHHRGNAQRDHGIDRQQADGDRLRARACRARRDRWPSTISHQMMNRSIMPSSRPRNDFSSIIGSRTPRFVALPTAPRK